VLAAGVRLCRIGHDDTGDGPDRRSWYCEKVSIEAGGLEGSSQKTWNFGCQQWCGATRAALPFRTVIRCHP
jgi:hypothetical protein